MSAPLVSGVTASGGAKVLITGGYLVLERANRGIVLSVDARLYSSVYSLGETNRAVENADNSVTIPLYVYTPQRQTAPFVLYITYKYGSDSEAMSVEITGDVEANSFVAKTVHTCIVSLSTLPRSVFEAKLRNGLFLVVRGSRPFYSSNPLPGSEGSTIINADGVCVDVLPVDNPADYTTKTGLGSSAALVSSLVGAFFGYFDSWNEKQEYALHVAQFSHCAAQGKVGSGFDVSAAFLGTHVYNRFSPSLIQRLLDTPTEATQTMLGSREECNKIHPYSDATMSNVILNMLEQPWDYIATPFTMPPRMQQMLGDVAGGSETPAMVKKVLAWHALSNKTEHATLWSDLAQANDAVYASLTQITKYSQEYPTEYHAVMDILSTKKTSEYSTLTFSGVQNTVFQSIAQLPVQFSQVRTRLQWLGDCAGVPIEPSTQTVVLDQTNALPGVLFSGVPGAGGYDAIFSITIDDQTAAVMNVWNVTEPQQINQLKVQISDQQGVSIRPSTIALPACIVDLL